MMNLKYLSHLIGVFLIVVLGSCDKEMPSAVDEQTLGESAISMSSATRSAVSSGSIIDMRDLPNEVRQTYEDYEQALLDFLGVQEMPYIEVAPNVYVAATEEFREGEKANELAAFKGMWIDNITSLFEEYQLMDNK